MLEVDRDGKTWRQEYAAVKQGRGAVKPGVPQGKLKAVAQSKRGHTGTSVTFWPDPDVFEETEYRWATVAERLQVMAFLNRGLAIVLADERPGHKQSQTFQFDGGIVDFVRHLNASKEPLFKDVGHFADKGTEGEVEVAWQWNNGLPRGPALVRERHLHDRGRDARRRVQARAHAGREPLRQGAQPREGQGHRRSRATTCARG